MRVGDDVDELTGDEPRDLREHTKQSCVLNDVPVVCGQHILRTLIEDAVEVLARDVEGHRVSAGVEIHLVQIGVGVDVGHNAAGCGVVLEIVENAVDLVELALAVLVLDTELIAVRLTDRAVLACPGIPDVGIKLGDLIRLLLPDPEDLVDAVLDARLTEGHYRELLTEIIAVGDAEFLYGVRGSAVVPTGTNVEIGIIKAVFKNIAAIFNINSVCVAHYNSP